MEKISKYQKSDCVLNLSDYRKSFGLPTYVLSMEKYMKPRNADMARTGIVKRQLGPMRPKAKGLAQHGGPSAWLEENESEVGKMTTFYLRPIPLPSTQQVDDLAYLSKKCWGERSMLTTFDPWKGRGGRHDLFLNESVKFHPSKSRHLQVSMPKVLRCSYPGFQY